MITIKNKIAIQKMAVAGKLLSEILTNVAVFVKVGISTLEIDTWIANQLLLKGLVSQAKGYKGYPYVRDNFTS